MLTLDLYPYQNEAINTFLERDNLLVAYEMGLGKTIIGIAAVEELIGLDAVKTAIIVVPAGLKYQWAQAIVKATDVPTRVIKVKGEEIVVPDESACIIMNGTPPQREALYAAIQKTRPEYIIMSYENVVNDWKNVSRIKPEMIVLDEATAIKSFKAQRTKKIKRLTSKYRMALTGTPVENRPEELFSIMQWVDSEVLGRFDLFDRAYIKRNHFGGVERYRNLDVLHTKLSAAMSRKTRLDWDVRPYLPEVDEDNWMVRWDQKTYRAYKSIAADLLGELENLAPTGGAFDLSAYYSGEMQPDDKSAAGRVMARQMALEMLLDHPDLVRRSAEKYLLGNAEGSKYAAMLVKAGTLDGVTSTPKLDHVVETVSDLLDSNPENKVIIFSFYRDMSEILANALPYGSVKFHGQMNAGEKAAAQAKFERDPDCRLFLSSHAGGYGVDLFMANHLINYDMPWSAGKQDQINARHVRASSRFDNVFIHNVLVDGSIEQRRHDVVSMKRRVGKAIMDGRGAGSKGIIENDVATLTNFLKATL